MIILCAGGSQSDPWGRGMWQQRHQGLKASMRISYDEPQDVLRTLLSEAAIEKGGFEKRQTRHYLEYVINILKKAGGSCRQKMWLQVAAVASISGELGPTNAVTHPR